MELTVMGRDRECVNCEFHKTAKSRCIPTSFYKTIGKPGEDRIGLLMVGEKPGVQEDRDDEHFTGEAGRYLKTVYVQWMDSLVERPVDVWLTNAVRCAPPPGCDPTNTHLKPCKKYLEDDIRKLAGLYPTIVVLLMGKSACQQVLECNYRDGIRRQGERVVIDGTPVRVFVTANPAILIPGRDPSHIRAIAGHLSMLVSFLNHDASHATMPDPIRLKLGDWIPPNSGLISIDIETYGAVDWEPAQTVFHPVRSLHADKVPADHMIKWVAMAGDSPGFGRWIWSCNAEENPEDAAQGVLRALYAGEGFLGMNLPFDLSYLRFVFPQIKEYMTVYQDNIRLADLAITSFLGNPDAPERGLKGLAKLYGIADYAGIKSLRDGYRYGRDEIKQLGEYCELDVLATLNCHNRISEIIRMAYPNTDKLSEKSNKWFSDVLWTVLEMDEAGVCFDRSAVARAEDIARKRIWRVRNRALKSLKLSVEGMGSAKSIQELLDTAVSETKTETDPRLKRTEKTRKISTCAMNVEFLLGKLPSGPTRTGLRLLSAFREHNKILTAYLSPLLTSPASGMIDSGMVYPSWYAVPSFLKDDAGGSGGTKQGRLTCRGPALQTLPKSVRKLIRSRFEGGSFILVDLSQIELRIAALMSGDPLMMKDYLDGTDRHSSTTKLIFGIDETNPEWDYWRKVGKVLNFLMLYGGQARKFQEVLQLQGVFLELDKCERMVRDFDRTYHVFRAWQAEELKRVTRIGHYEVPITGESRSFVGTPWAIEKTYAGEIANFPIQLTAANVMKCAQRAVSDQFRRDGMQSLVCLNIYDAMGIDSPGSEEVRAIETAKHFIACNPYYHEIQSIVGRTVPLDCDVKVVRRV